VDGESKDKMKIKIVTCDAAHPHLKSVWKHLLGPQAAGEKWKKAVQNTVHLHQEFYINFLFKFLMPISRFSLGERIILKIYILPFTVLFCDDTNIK
jgi:hypothetical protein